MRKIVLFLFLLALASPLEAKTVKAPKGNHNVNQLHDELLAKFPTLRGTPQPDGSFQDPLMRVESTDTEILLTVPEETDEALLKQVISSHVPKAVWPPKPPEPLAKEKARGKLKALGFTDEEIAHILK